MHRIMENNMSHKFMLAAAVGILSLAAPAAIIRAVTVRAADPISAKGRAPAASRLVAEIMI